MLANVVPGMIYNFYIFGRGRRCLCREEWNRIRPCADVTQETKFISGTLLTLTSLCSQLGPPGGQFTAYTTPQYKLHAFSTATGYRLVLTTDPSVRDLQDTLRHIYAELFVEHVVKNPLYRIGEDVSKCTTFLSKLHSFVQTRPFFAISA